MSLWVITNKTLSPNLQFMAIIRETKIAQEMLIAQ